MLLGCKPFATMDVAKNSQRSITRSCSVLQSEIQCTSSGGQMTPLQLMLESDITLMSEICRSDTRRKCITSRLQFETNNCWKISSKAINVRCNTYQMRSTELETLQ